VHQPRSSLSHQLPRCPPAHATPPAAGELAKSSSIKVEHPKEQELALHLCKFPEAVEDMLEELAPNRLTDYLYELSEKFNGFYMDCKVVGNEHEDSRLLLCEATAVVMRQVFQLLGITPLYRI
jgi:arginyl-tRNA synthetase